MLNFNSLLLFSDNPKRLVDFYKNIFDKDSDWTGGDFVGFEVGDGRIAIGPHDKVKGKSSNPERIIFNLESDDVEKEFERIQEKGATVIQKPYQPSEDPDMKIATFADPDGNYFQLMSEMEWE